MSEDMKRVFRYEVPVDDRPHTFRLTSNPLAVSAVRGRTGHTVEFWAEHHGDFYAVERTFIVYGTGQPIHASAKWWGTAQRVGDLIWHLYELPGGAASEQDSEVSR